MQCRVQLQINCTLVDQSESSNSALHMIIKKITYVDGLYEKNKICIKTIQRKGLCDIFCGNLKTIGFLLDYKMYSKLFPLKQCL